MDAALTLTDFPDRISPMVVKELRQGLRTRLFVGVLWMLHLTLVLLTLISGSAQNNAEAQGWFDGIITLVLCLILPMRGFSAMADELKSGTLDMLVLTRLSAGRIVFGKWASIVSQSLLIALSILPYVVARYVFGGLDLFGEIAVLFYKWLGGAVAAAAIIAVSTQRLFWVRALIVGLPVLIGGFGMFSFMMISGIGGMAGGSMMASAITELTSASTFFMILGAGIWLVFFFLSLGATRHAPAASLLPVVKRGVHFGVFALVLLAAVVFKINAVVVAAAAVLWLVMMDALTEHVNDVPSVYAAFYRRGWVGRTLLWVLAPGWVTGFCFTLLMVGMVAGATWWLSSAAAAQMVFVGACGTWMISLLIQVLPTSRKARDLLLPFICYWVGVSLALAMLASVLIMPFAARGDTPWFTCAVPQFVPLGYAAAQAGDRDALLQNGTLAALAWPALLLVVAFFAWRRVREARREGWRIVHGGEGGAAA